MKNRANKEIEFLKKSVVKILFFSLVIASVVIGFMTFVNIVASVGSYVADNPMRLIPAALIILITWAIKTSFEEVYPIGFRDYITKKFKKEKDNHKHVKNDDQNKTPSKEARNT